jgi:WD40 repeat protein
VGAVTNAVVGSSSNLRNASYSDVARRWDGLPSGHLESLVGSSSSVTAAVVNSRTELSSILDAAYDRSIGGTEGSQSQLLQQDVLVPSILQKPVQLLRGGEETSNNAVKEISTNADLSSTMRQANDSNKAIPSPVEMKLVVGSDSNRIECLSAQASRRYLTIRATFEEEKRTIQQIKRSLAYQKHIKIELDDETTTLLSTHCAGVGSSAAEVKDDQLSTSDCLAQKKLENDRIIAQLGRKLEEIQNLHYGVTDKELTMASSVADALWKESVSMMNTFMDPSFITKTSYHNNSKLHGHKTNSILSHVTGRSYGVGIRQRKGALRQRIGINSSDLSIKQRSKGLISRRLAHVITINAHLFCPVYCLRFDRTGRVFVTGADDNLVKLFRIGSTVKSNNTEKQKYDSRNRGYSYQQGAVLVCTLRGHASVITDIDVSADNALLATASEDGDVRVWGMADGCPVAILRGHEGGANMVSKREQFHFVVGIFAVLIN